MIGKRFSSDDAVLGRLRRLQKRVASFQSGGSTTINNIIAQVITGVEWKTDDCAVLLTDFGNIFIMNSAGSKTFTLPAVTAASIGLDITLVKRGAGKVTVQAGGADTIQDSAAGGSVYNDLAEETFALVKLRVIASGAWIIEFFTGSGWRTS
jgi:hypothetical protein